MTILIQCKCGAQMNPLNLTPLIKDNDPDYWAIICDHCATVIELPQKLQEKLEPAHSNEAEE